MTDQYRPAALGLRAHSGWAALVVVGGSAATPVVLDRRRIELATQTPAQPYHQAATLKNLPMAAALIDRARDDAVTRAARSIDDVLTNIRQRGYGGRCAALLVKPLRPLPALALILRAHPLLHTAEGELFRHALAQACEGSGLTVVPHREDDLWTESSRALSRTPASLRDQLTAWGRSVGPPWTTDYKMAAVAAWCALGALETGGGKRICHSRGERRR